MPIPQPQVNAEDLFLKGSKRAKLPTLPSNQKVRQLLDAIIDRTYIGRSIAILDDEVQNFDFIRTLAEEARSLV